MKKLALGILGAFLAVIAATGVYDIATGQPIGTTTLALTPGSSTVAPAIRATGAPANISINLVPKGTGTVLINGTPIGSGAQTFTSATINPGPLDVTGTTNLTGPLFIQPGTAVGLKRVGARIFHTATLVPTVGTSTETLYTFTMLANTLGTDGESLRLVFRGAFAANGNTKGLGIAFGATEIWGTGQGAFNGNLETVQCDVVRLTATTQRAGCVNVHTVNAGSGTVAGANVIAGGNGNGGMTTPGETLTGPVTIIVQALTPTAAADAIGQMFLIDWYPVGQ